MEKYSNIPDGATLQCTLGSQNSKLRVASSHGAKIGGKLEATIQDYQPGVNIMTFGMCMRSVPPLACTPTVMNPWLLGNKGHEINGEPALMSNSILSCACGGIIKILSN